MNRWTILALGLLCASLAAVVFGALRFIGEERAEMMSRFAQERVEQVEQAARIIDEDLVHVGEDLRVAGQLARQSSSADEMGRELTALLDVVEYYRLIHVYDEAGHQLFSAGDGRRIPGNVAVDQIMAESAAAAQRGPDDGMFVSNPLDESEAFRVFATVLPKTSSHPTLSVALLVDTTPLLDKLRLVSSGSVAHLLVLGPYGNPTPVSDSALSLVVRNLDVKRPEFRGYAELIDRMRQGERGVLRIDREEASRLGLGSSDVFAAYASTPSKRGGSWSICALRSASRVEAHDRIIVRRLGLASALVAALIVAFGAYVVIATRRAVADQERLKHLAEAQLLGAQLVRAEKLATVGVLAAGIAHEIGTPLAVVRGRAEYLAGKLGPDHPQSRGIQVIVDQIDVVSRTIRQLLDFARVRPPATAQPVQVGEVARAVAELLRYEAERRKVALDLDLPEGLPAVAANADELQQTLVNLVMNGCHACAPGGHVQVSARAEEPASPGSAALVRIEVSDDGHGIPAEHRAQVFDPFFTTKKRGQGTGLGLTIAAQIVRNHGGQIELESEPERGSRVTLLWPSAPRPAKDAPVGRAPVP